MCARGLLTLRVIVAVFLGASIIIVFRHYVGNEPWPLFNVKKSVIGVLGTIFLSGFAAGLLEIGAMLQRKRDGNENK